MDELIARCDESDAGDAVQPAQPASRAQAAVGRPGLRSGEAWVLTEGWDFRIESHRKAALRYQEDEKPLVVIGVPHVPHLANNRR